MAEEKVELSEQTPLKEDTDNKETAETTADPSAAASAEKKEVEKKRWFFNKKAKKEDKPAEEGEKAEGKDVEAGESVPAEKKPRWWHRKPCCKSTEGQQPTFGVDYVRRDEQGLQTVIDLNFGDIFGEPDAVHSLNGVWRTTNSIFLAVRSFFYKLFTIILCVPAAIIFGVLFAFFSAIGVFIIVPAGKLLAVPVSWIVKLWSYLTSNVIGPLFAGIGQIASQVKVHKYGINTDPTATINA